MGCPLDFSLELMGSRACAHSILGSGRHTMLIQRPQVAQVELIVRRQAPPQFEPCFCFLDIGPHFHHACYCFCLDLRLSFLSAP